MNNTEIWLERLNSLYNSQVRQAVSAEGIQSVHFEILQYLTMCNDYSNTAQALVEYLGQTKGSISQSLTLMQKSEQIERRACSKDKRVSKLHITKRGRAVYNRVRDRLALHNTVNSSAIDAIKSLLGEWQGQTGRPSFGQCKSCRYNQQRDNGEFFCGLTKDDLSNLDILKICREHEFSSATNT